MSRYSKRREHGGNSRDSYVLELPGSVLALSVNCNRRLISPPGGHKNTVWSGGQSPLHTYRPHCLFYELPRPNRFKGAPANESQEPVSMLRRVVSRILNRIKES